MVLLADIAKVLIGVFAADFAFHAGLLLSRSEPKLFGMKFSNKMNSAALVVNVILIAVLAWLAWL